MTREEFEYVREVVIECEKKRKIILMREAEIKNLRDIIINFEEDKELENKSKLSDAFKLYIIVFPNGLYYASIEKEETIEVVAKLEDARIFSTAKEARDVVDSLKREARVIEVSDIDLKNREN